MGDRGIWLILDPIVTLISISPLSTSIFMAEAEIIPEIRFEELRV
jgi:hypothetical protein